MVGQFGSGELKTGGGNLRHFWDPLLLSLVGVYASGY